MKEHEKAPPRFARRRLVRGLLLAGTAVVLAGIALQPATAAPVKWLAVQLGTHQFGHLSAPDAIVADAGATDVGFAQTDGCACGDGSEQPPSAGCGCSDGPQGPTSFDVAPDGSTWLLDVLNHRFLVWSPGRADGRARAIALPPNLGVRDFAVGWHSTIYVYGTDLTAGHTRLYALTATGRVLWKVRTISAISNPGLFIGPGGALYGALLTDSATERPTDAWTSLTTPAGKPLAVAAQRRRITRFQPLTGGMGLRTTWRSSHDVRFVLVDKSSRIVRAWNITSKTEIGPVRAAAALVGGDLVVPIDLSKQTKKTFLWEHVVLRLSATGEIRQVALDARSVWGDDGDSTPLQIGADGRLYQLRTDPTSGVTVARYSLGH